MMKMRNMRSKSNIKNELLSIKKALTGLQKKEDEMQTLINGKGKAEETSSSLLKLYEIMMQENKTTRTLLLNMSQVLSKLESELAPIEEYEVDNVSEQPREVPLSELDAKILQIIQIKGMACADDIKKEMNYKGRNAASARLNNLRRQGLIERYQLGHKVYYKFSASKATKETLIVSPPQ